VAHDVLMAVVDLKIGAFVQKCDNLGFDPNSARAPLRKISVNWSAKIPG